MKELSLVEMVDRMYEAPARLRVLAQLCESGEGLDSCAPGMSYCLRDVINILEEVAGTLTLMQERGRAAE